MHHHHHHHVHHVPDKHQTTARWCCCPLHSVVMSLSILLISLYLVTITVSTIIWILHSDNIDDTSGTVIEVNSFYDVLDDIPQDDEESENNIDIIVIILISTIVVSIIGIITTIILILGVTKRSPYLLLPWLIWHMAEILGTVASGLYLVIHFLLLLEERNVTNAILSLIPIFAGIFLIFPWVLVDQLYVNLKKTKIIIEMDNPITRSLSSLSVRPAPISRAGSHLDTLRSNKSSRSVKSKLSVRSVRSVKKRNDQRRQHNQFHFRPDVLSRKSRSLEHILDNTSSSSSGGGSSYDQLAAAGLTTLPRLRRCDQNPGMWRAAYNTDTMRSCKSVGSIKSVQISNRVTEFHYSDSEHGHDRTHNDVNDIIDNTYDNRVFEHNEDLTDDGVREMLDEPPPPPVYPTINSKKSWNYKLADKKNTFTKDQIIDLYCTAGQNMDR